jgi:hypothetical protein
MSRSHGWEKDPIFVEARGNLVRVRIGWHGRGEGRIAYLSPAQAEKIAAALMRSSRQSYGRLVVARLKCSRNQPQDERHLSKLCR